jgi:predicted AlkP superfamily pyrophosphatase or phosphodiesterase
VDTADTKFCRRLMSEGAFTRKMVPVFPSLTFPSHVSQATGASVNRHGIIANAIYDDEKDVRWSYPNVAKEVLCEPIWNTVKRGGKRVLVYDWPVSQQQTGEFKADYFDQAYNTGLSDQQRLDRLIETWKKDDGKQPLQLLMGYVSGDDKAGHKYGPNAPQTKAAVEATDALLADFFKQCQQVFREKMSADDTLYFILSTDHGMDDVRVVLNPRLMCGSAWNDEMRLVASGSVAHIFLERLGPPPARKPHIQKLKKVLQTYKFAKVFARDELPKEWEYDHPTRTGDVVMSVDTGYFFSEREGPEMSSIDPTQGPLGMHGYSASENPNMLGFLGLWRSGKPIGGVDLGELDSRRLHATVAHLLNVRPAETAVPDPIKLP